MSHAALAAGKHVFSEKPLCVESEHGRALVAEASRRGLRLGCAPDTFLGAGGRLAREIIDSGKIGTVLSGTCFLMSHGMEHWHPDPEFYFKPGGGPILDMAPYYLAALINLIGPVASVQARASTGFAERVVTAAGPRKGQAITVETPTTVMALVRFASGADIVFTMSWDVWKHGHPPIELYGTEGSLRVPDPNFFGGAVEYTERGGDWVSVDSSEQAVRTAELAFAGLARHDAGSRQLPLPRRRGARERGGHGTPHRSSGALASHALDVMHAILQAAEQGGSGRGTIKPRAAGRHSPMTMPPPLRNRIGDGMPATMKGPAIFLAQFAGDAAPFNSFESICGWAAGLGYKGVQIPSWDGRLFDLDKAAASQTYCDEIKGVAARHGIAITELSTHLQGQLVAVHPAYDEAFDAFAPAPVKGNPKARQAWAVDQLTKAAAASQRLGLTASVTFSGALAWPLSLSLAAAPGGTDRDRVRRARAALEADPRRL